MDNEPKPQPLPVQPRGSWLQRIGEHKLWIGMGALALLWMIKAKDQPEDQVKQNQSLQKKQESAATRTKVAEISDQKLPDGPKVVDRPAATSERRESAQTQKTRAQEAQDALRYRSLYEVNFVTSPIQTAQAAATLGSTNPVSQMHPVSQPVQTKREIPTEKRNPLDFDPTLPQVTLPEDSVIEMALDNKLEGEMTGPVECHVTTPIYAPGTQTVVIPAGSRVSGQSTKVGNFGQQRLLVTFHRILVTDRLGAPLYAIPLTPQEPGMDQQGGMGISGKVNNHIASTVLASLAVGLLGAGSSGFGYSQNGGAIILGGIGQNTSQASTRIFERYSNQLPTIYKDPGARVKLLLVDDLRVPIYDTRN